MKLLIAYDGSKHSEAALDDLARSGLPEKGVAEVISVAEVWLPPPGSVDGEVTGATPLYITAMVREYQEKGERAVAEAEMLAGFAETRVKAALPKWDVASRATYGSPGWEILYEAEALDADLILVGSQGHSALGRFVLGSVSQKVLTEADCSVRVARGSIDVDPALERIVTGFDGSRGAQAAVEAVASRKWNKGTDVRLVAVTESVVPNAIGRFVAPITRIVNEINVSERTWFEHLAENSLTTLIDAGLQASLQICPGNPKHVLSEEAERWGADSIFVGANAWGSRLERILVGSTAAAVAARSHCSVEIVRIKAGMIPNEGTNGRNESGGQV